MDNINYCEAITQKGIKCKYKANSIKDGKHYCGIHNKNKNVVKISLIDDKTKQIKGDEEYAKRLQEELNNYIREDEEYARRLQNEINRSDDIYDNEEEFVLNNTRNRRIIQPLNDGNDYEELLRLAERLGDVKKKGMTIEEINNTTLMSRLEKINEQDNKCLVCQDEYIIGNEVRRLPCTHFFHKDCVDCWLKDNSNCPICRLKL